MRTDIQVHIDTKDIAIVDASKDKRLFDFHWVTHSTGSAQYMYGEVVIPASFHEDIIREKGFCISIPYTPHYKKIMLRVKRAEDENTHIYLNNIVNTIYLPLKDRISGANNWFLVKSGLYGGAMLDTFASELVNISGPYFVKLVDGYAELYSSINSDLNIIDANRQNANCMLACAPSNNYRYPLTGVGLIRWMNSGHVNSSGLGDIVQREFNNDGLAVKNAYYNYDNNKLNLDLLLLDN